MKRLGDRLVSWASELEPDTLEQARRSSELPFIYPHLALMPDAHLGLGATVGSVIPTEEAVIPAAVGVDIGCGMIAVRTPYTTADIAGRDRADLRRRIERAVPVSAGGYNKTLSDSAAERVRILEKAAEVDYAEVAANWRLQLGTLGGGNHFIEVCADERDRIWLFLHSGSRGIGNKLATKHIKVAREQMVRKGIQLPDKDLAYLEEGTDEFDAYIRDLLWAQEFALLNREEMMDRVVRCFADWIGEQFEEVERINCHHNFTKKEHHFGRDVWVSRKGAIEATVGKPGLIPGSMGTPSYIVTGKGNADALNSAPHGAGRRLSRNAARKKFGREHLRAAMKGIEYRDTAAFIDEIPAAYKDIDRVIDDSRDLVEVRHTLRQLVNVKGD